MLRAIWRLSRGNRLRPWKSPYLRWRIETYAGIHADRIDFVRFWKFVWKHRADLFRYARWAALEEQATAQERAAGERDNVKAVAAE